MKLLITGCTGLLGSNLCYLLRNHHDVTGISRGSFSMENVESYRISFADTVAMEELLKRENFDLIVHCAAITNVDECESDRNRTMETNAYAPIRLAALAHRYRVKFVFISSDAVFSGNKQEAYTECDPTCPINVYGISKSVAEAGILEQQDSLIVRTNMYGFNWQEKTSLCEWITESLVSGTRVKLFYDVIFSPLLVNTLVEAIMQAVKKDMTGIVHLGCLSSVSKLDFGCKIAELLNIDGLIDACSVDEFNFQATRAHNMSLDCGLAIKKGIVLPSIEDDLNEMMRLRSADYGHLLRRSRSQ